jgi:putative ABC transport system permease protein
MFLAIRELRAARGRFALMAGVIGLVSMLVVLLSGLTAGLSHQSVSAITSLPADAITFAAPAPGEAVSFSSSRVTSSEALAVRQQPGVSHAELLGVAPTRLRAAGTEAAVTAFGIVPGSTLAPADVHVGDVVVGSATAEKAGLAPGSKVGIGGESYRVAALVPDQYFSHTPVVWIPLQDWRQLDSAGGAEGTVVVSAGPGADLTAVDTAEKLQSTDVTGALAAVGSYTAENGSLTLMRLLLLAASALIVGSFFTIWTIQRTPDLAVLKAIGARTRYLVKDSLAQAFILILVGGGLGTLLAAGLGLLAERAVPFVVSTDTTLLPLGLLLVVGMVAAAASLRRVATVDPITALGAAR